MEGERERETDNIGTISEPLKISRFYFAVPKQKDWRSKLIDVNVNHSGEPVCWHITLNGLL